MKRSINPPSSPVIPENEGDPASPFYQRPPAPSYHPLPPPISSLLSSNSPPFFITRLLCSHITRPRHTTDRHVLLSKYYYCIDGSSLIMECTIPICKIRTKEMCIAVSFVRGLLPRQSTTVCAELNRIWRENVRLKSNASVEGWSCTYEHIFESSCLSCLCSRGEFKLMSNIASAKGGNEAMIHREMTNKEDWWNVWSFGWKICMSVCGLCKTERGSGGSLPINPGSLPRRSFLRHKH